MDRDRLEQATSIESRLQMEQLRSLYADQAKSFVNLTCLPGNSYWNNWNRVTHLQSLWRRGGLVADRRSGEMVDNRCGVRLGPFAPSVFRNRRFTLFLGTAASLLYSDALGDFIFRKIRLEF